MVQYYPESTPYKRGHLSVGDGHQIYFECVGTQGAIPVVFLHGGPGGNISPFYRRFFNPKQFNVLLFDQRGAGRSTPFACVENNTTHDLVADIERLREMMGIDRWIVFGGSWGATLALAYATAHPKRVLGVVLRGVFLGRQSELDWLYGPMGAGQLFPEEYAQFVQNVPEQDRPHPYHTYYRWLNDENITVRRKATAAWNRWENQISQLIPTSHRKETNAELDKGLAIARIETHYFVNQLFLEHDNAIFDKLSVLDNLPVCIVNGRYDVVCPPVTAYEVQQAIEGATLTIVPDAGHSTSEPGIAEFLIKTMDRLGTMLSS
ncbi:MAG: prolyl aminopeptidase [Myxococcota bacterium]